VAASAFTQGRQSYSQLDFSDLPITLAHSEHCLIDVYFWRRRATTIHNHHFSGAFVCLEGKNIDLEFQFSGQKMLGQFHELGTLSLHQSRTIGKGDIATVAPLEGFIHQTHHHADLTANLIFRTRDYQNKNLSSYLFSGLRFEKDPGLLGRVARLQRLIELGKVDIPTLSLTVDDMLVFLMNTHGHSSKLPLLLKTIATFEKRLEDEHGISLPALLEKHHQEFDRIENDYE
jgi:hypothetical protein